MRMHSNWGKLRWRKTKMKRKQSVFVLFDRLVADRLQQFIEIKGEIG